MSSKKQISSKKKYLPFFVYGTLLQGLHNFNRLLAQHKPRVQAATLPEHVLLASRAAGFPYMAETVEVEKFNEQGITRTELVLGVANFGDLLCDRGRYDGTRDRAIDWVRCRWREITGRRRRCGRPASDKENQ